jgi:hypothetical protein
MAPKRAAAKEKPDASSDKAPSKAGGAGRGQGRPANLGLGTSGGGTQLTLGLLLGKRKEANATEPAGAASGGVSGGGSAEPAPPEAPPFENAQELGDKWHGLIGTGDWELDEPLVEKTLLENPQFMRRVLSTTGDGIFFGPAKELLLSVAKRLHATAGGGSELPQPETSPLRRTSPRKRKDEAGPSRDDGDGGAEQDEQPGGGIKEAASRWHQRDLSRCCRQLGRCWGLCLAGQG